MDLKKYDVTVRVYDPDRENSATDYVLPVDSPDAEHAASATMSNAVAFTTKLEGDRPLPLAFRCIRIEQRDS